MMKQIPYGLTDFARIQKDNYYYVDKTMFIERIEMQPAYLFLIRPRRFGKSLTLAMLEAYYDVVYANDFDELFGHLYIGQHPTPKHNCYLIMRFNFSEVSSNVNEVERSFKLHCCSKLRDFVFKYEDFYIIDAHMPLNPKDDKRYSDNNKKRAEEVEKLWEKIREYLKDKKDEKLIFIGDLNVYQRGTHQYESFVPLFKLDVNMRDLWLEQGGKDNAITCKKGTRLDYALVTPGLYEKYKCTMSMIPESDEEFEKNWHISDHRMLVVDIEEDDMRENDYKDTERRILCSVMERMFPDGGETYTIEEVKRLFEEEGVHEKNFEDALSKCIKEGWIIDCGNGNYTR